MAALPKSYVSIVRNLTGYWGTYPPGTLLYPGTIGRVVDGVLFVEGHLEQKRGFDSTQHFSKKQANRVPVNVWTTRNVSMDVAGSELSAPAGAAVGRIRLRFGGANEAAIICNGSRQWLFSDLEAVKAFMRKLLEENLWDRESCLVTEVMLVESAWICFATEKGQAAEIKSAATVPLPTAPNLALNALAGRGELTMSGTSIRSAGFCSTLGSGSTPLFRAMRFKSNPIFSDAQTIHYLKGSSQEFEEPTFGSY